MNATSNIARRPFNRRLLALAVIVIVALPLAGCFDNEPQQRRAFIAFLQKRIIDKPGLHIPILSEKETADLGSYASQYRIMNGFHHELDATIDKDLTRAMQIGTPRSLEELASHRDIYPLVRSGMANMKASLDKAEAAADAAHTALQQPPDLKAVYDIAYERMVTKPARVFRELGPMILNTLPAIEELAAYLDEHRAVIEFRGGAPATNDAGVRTKLAALIEAAGKAAEASAEGKRKLREMAEGH